MPNRKIRVVLDTNLWISFLLNRDLSKLDALLLEDKVELIFSEALLNEFLDVVQRPKFKKYFSDKEIDKVISVIGTLASFVNVKTEVNICRDEKDNFLLALAIDGLVDFLLTGDHDLLELKTIGSTKIMKITSYLASR